MKIGDKVKHSEYALRPKRDYWQSLGHEPAKSRAKSTYLAYESEVGIVIEVSKTSVTVVWNDRYTSSCVSWMIEPIINKER